MSRAHTAVDVINNSDAFLALEHEWNALWIEAGGHHNQAFQFNRLSWTLVAEPDDRRLRCITIRVQGKLVLVWPLVAYRRGVWTVLNTLTPGSVEQNSMLVKNGPDADALIDAAWHAGTHACGADVVFLPFVRNGTRLHQLACEHKGLMDIKDNQTSAALLRGGPDWDSLCKSLNRKPGIRERRLGRQGVMTMGMMELPDSEYAHWVDWILETKRGWGERVDKKGPWLYSQAYRDFLVGLFDSTRGEPLARIFSVQMDGKVIAAAILGVGKGCHYYMIGSFLDEWSRFSPGTILNEFVIRHCIEQDMDLDFGVGTEEFKIYWSRGNISRTSSFQIANGFAGKLYFRSKDVAQALKSLRTQSRTQKEPEAIEDEAVLSARD
jgi:CelD/BcsL family acetyltransferase involved in cellulose biosynthesis